MYGTNDAMNFGGHFGGTLSLSEYPTDLKELVKRRQLAGATVVLMTPPPTGVSEREARIAPYRAESKRVGAELDVPIVDTSEVLSGIPNKWVDGLHLNERSLEMLAQFLRSHIYVTRSKELLNAP
jgi:lysophospholipase L1-like esterase